MSLGSLITLETTKSPAEYARALEEVARPRGFMFHNADHMNMAETFASFDMAMPEGFDLHMIQLCKPDKSSKMLAANPLRAVLMPKFVIVWTDEAGRTQIRMVRYDAEQVGHLLDDADFATAMKASYDAIETLLNEALYS